MLCLVHLFLKADVRTSGIVYSVLGLWKNRLLIIDLYLAAENYQVRYKVGGNPTMNTPQLRRGGRDSFLFICFLPVLVFLYRIFCL